MKSLIHSATIDVEIPINLMKRRKHPTSLKLQDLKFLRYCRKWNDVQFCYLHRKSNKEEWSENAYVPFQLFGHIHKRTLSCTIKKNGSPHTISCHAPGDDVWHSQKCYTMPIKFQQARTYNCLPNSLASALYYLGDRKICFGLTHLANTLIGKS